MMRKLLDHMLYPLLFGAGFLVTWMFSSAGWSGFIGGTIAYWLYILALRWLEQVRPFEPAWRQRDGQLANDIALPVIGYLAVPYAVWLPQALTALVERVPALGLLNVWPSGLPAIIAFPLGFIIYDFGVYWAHRLGHEWKPLWRLHAVHHSAPRLSVLNTGRHHIVEAVIVKAFFVPIPLLLGVPAEVAVWFVALRTYGGILTHANIDMRSGIFSYIVNTPELHRWHHSTYQPETDTNYGATVFWDRMLGSYYRPARRPPRQVGVDFPVSSKLVDLLIHPFTRLGHRSGDSPIVLLPEGDAGVGSGSDVLPRRVSGSPAPLSGEISSRVPT